MARLTAAHYAAVWIAEGGNPAKAVEAAAVGMCESGGNPSAVSNASARGPWQFIPTTLASDECAFSLRCSTRETIKLSKNGTDWSAWDCHPDAIGRTGSSSGLGGGPDIESARRTISQATEAGWFGDLFKPRAPWAPGGGLGVQPRGGGDSGLPSLPSIPGISDLTSAVGDIANVIVRMGELLFTPEGWLRMGKVLGGALLVIWGINLLAKQTTGTNPVGKVKGAAKMAATRGAAQTAKAGT